MIKLTRYLKGSAVICAILAPLAMCLEVAMDLLQPTLLSNIIDIGVANGDINYVLSIGIKMVLAISRSKTVISYSKSYTF